jgi:alkanesulfonate monooxygenase SsuD/methylene tetrahydromethanopterin reductase-like flavin-dependent oxidoreductase (luciferase family)
VSDYGHELEFGVSVTPSNQSADSVVGLSVMADRAGLDLVSFQDHPYNNGFLFTADLLFEGQSQEFFDTVTALAEAAAAAQRGF